MSDPYRTINAHKPTWFTTRDSAIRISEIRSAAFYPSNADKPHPFTVTFKTGGDLCLNREEGLRLLELLND